jgi:hypothetical protein
MLQAKRQSQQLDDWRWWWLAMKRLAPWLGSDDFRCGFDRRGIVGRRRMRNVHLVRHRRMRDWIVLRKILPKL